MKRYLTSLASVLALAVTIGVGSAAATTISTNNLQNVLDNFTVAPTSGVSSVNVQTDQMSADSSWSITGSGGTLATFVVELSGYANSNTFGLYDVTDSAKMVNIFAGSNTSGDQAVISIKSDGSVYKNFADTGINFAGNSIGYYITTPQGVDGVTYTYFSDTSLNPDGVDHMVAYQGTGTDTIQLPTYAPGLWTDNEYLLAWEDAYGGIGGDYADLVVMVESVSANVSVPEPGTMMLLGSGLVALALYRRRRNRG